MATSSHTPEGDAARVTPPAMTRCECAGVSFEEIARRLHDSAASVDDVCRGTGCGGTCTACLPDLARFLSARLR